MERLGFASRHAEHSKGPLLRPSASCAARRSTLSSSRVGRRVGRRGRVEQSALCVGFGLGLGLGVGLGLELDLGLG